MELGEREFRLFRELIRARSGIHLSENKHALVQARLMKRIRALGLPSFEAYYRHVEADTANEEIVSLLDVISTNVTSFFREGEHFRFLTDVAIPEIVARNDSYCHVWSAACSTGEETYSIAMTFAEAVEDLSRLNLKILATDISRTVLGAAQAGRYRDEKVRDVPPALLQKHFARRNGDGRAGWEVREDLKRLVRFFPFNLNAPRWPFEKKFDVIFLRNVLIYFARDTQQALVARMAEALKPGGYFFVGHAESLTGIQHPFRFVKATIYRK